MESKDTSTDIVKVRIVETLLRVIEIDKSKLPHNTDIIEYVETMYNNEQIVLNSDDYIDVAFDIELDDNDIDIFNDDPSID